MRQEMVEAHVAQVRRFNRIATERAGALDDAFLGRGRPLGQARLVWEIGADGADVRDLRARLGLDSGYTSRLLRVLERDGLVAVGASSDDGRRRRASLTAKGMAEWRELDQASDRRAESVLAPLGERRRTELVEAMATVERLLSASSVVLEEVDPEERDARWCLERYLTELRTRCRPRLDPGSGPVLDPAELRAPRGAFLLARLQGAPVGCGALRGRDGAPPEVKRMWIAPETRGLGIGRRLLDELERRAAASGARTVRLETNEELTEAIGLYRAAGYREVDAFNDEPYAHHWFEKQL